MNATPSIPRTILEIVGAAPDTARLSNAVLLIIDAQQEYVDGKLPLAGIHESLLVGGTLLQRAREANTPVVHVLHRGAGPLFNPDGDGFKPAAPMTPSEGEAVVEKTLANAFNGTTLQATLEATGRRNLIVIGYMTHNCVSSTVRAAKELGYAITVVAPATGTRDLPDGQGGFIPAATLQSACLTGLADTMARVVWQASDIHD